MKIAVSGGTGFVGRALTNELLKQGHEVFILTRKPPSGENNGPGKLSYIQWLSPDSDPAAELKEIDVVINLAGEPIGNARWTNKRKERILRSRIETTEEWLNVIKKLDTKPEVFINASAIGYYGTSFSKTFTEKDYEPGTDFLAFTASTWEKKALEVETLGIRTVLMRFGIILGADEGALPKMVLPYTLFVGGTLGSGKQWLSWIHIEDVVRAILFLIENETISGPVNFTAPNPVTMKEFGKTVAKVLRRPHWFPVPSFLLRIVLGEMSLLVVEGQKVLPEKLLEAGFQFHYPTLEMALTHLLKNNHA